MRHAELGGMKEIERAICRLKDRHDEHIAAYGEGNEKRLTGLHETASIREFTWGVADRGASIRVGNETYKDGCGYLEDRRPSANCDPYVVTSMLAETTLAVSGVPLLPVPEETKDDAPGAKPRLDDLCFPGIERLDMTDATSSASSAPPIPEPFAGTSSA
jgi:glutamine synthetase